MNAESARVQPLTSAERRKLAIHRWLDKHLSPLGVWIMRRTSGRVANAWKVNALVLTTRGRKSGRQRRVVLQYFPDGDAMVVVAANDGGASHPAWYLNLMDTPDAVVEVDGHQTSVRAWALEADEAREWWDRIVEAAPDYKQYRRATLRPFPIIRLAPPRPSAVDRRS